MSYTKTEWVNGQAPAINANNLNKMEKGIYDAHVDIAKKQDKLTAGTNVQIVNNTISVPSAGLTAEQVKALFGDYVVTTGTAGIWKYRKWSSGKIEAWANIDVSISSSKVTAIYRAVKEVTIPTGIFTAPPTNVTATNNVTSATTKQMGVAVMITSATNITLEMFRDGSGDVVGSVSVYAVQD